MLIIKQSRIRNPERHLYEFFPDEGLYVTAPVSDETEKKLVYYGIRMDGVATIPRPIRSATSFNANGRWIAQKNLPKEPRSFEHDYHIVDWHGNDHYGTCWQTRMCYQRELIPPTELVFKIENGTVFSELFHNSVADYPLIKQAINVLLEICGFCELWTEEKSPAIPPVRQETVPWEILRSGSRDQGEWSKYIDKITQSRSKSQRAVIKQRHEHLWEQAPDFCVLGTQNFWGYVVYGFTPLNLFIFECNQPDNATYVFKGDWETASKLTKTEILSGHVQEARLFHTESWYRKVQSMIQDNRRKIS